MMIQFHENQTIPLTEIFHEGSHMLLHFTSNYLMIDKGSDAHT